MLSEPTGGESGKRHLFPYPLGKEFFQPPFSATEGDFDRQGGAILL